MSAQGKSHMLDLSNPIFQSPTKRPKLPNNISRTTSTANMYKAEKTVEPSSPKRGLPRQASQAVLEVNKQVCCPNCRYLFKVHTTPIKQNDAVQKILNSRSYQTQTEPQIEVIEVQPLMEKVEQLGHNQPFTPLKLSEEAQPTRLRSHSKSIMEPVTILPTPNDSKQCQQLAYAYDVLLRERVVLFDLLDKMRQRLDVPSYVKYLDAANMQGISI